MPRNKNFSPKELLIDILTDVFAGLLIALETYNFSSYAKFPMSGFNGIGLIFYHLFNLPIGAVTTEHAKIIAPLIEATTGRGCTFLKAEGSYSGIDKDVIMCATNRKEMYGVRKAYSGALQLKAYTVHTIH